jgi:probable F420-dependent oxidoreductase
MKYGIALGALNPAFFEEVVLEAEALGFESIWLPEHLVFTEDMSGSPFAGAEHPPVPPTTPVFDAFAMLSYLAGRTSKVRLGTNVYLLALRHPFVAARAVQTLDIVSGGRAEVGIGAGWLRQEWRAAGFDPRTRGRRLDEAMTVCRKLWTEERIQHEGEFYSFESVAFEPKPIQKPYPPILVGGESAAALERAARLGDGWLGLEHTPQSARPLVEGLHARREALGRSDLRFSSTVMGAAQSADDVQGWEQAGVDRVIVAPWRRSREAIVGMRAFAERVF